jgi:anti-anti-sigma factor
MPGTFSVPDSLVPETTLPAVFVSSQIHGDPDAVCVHAAGELDIAAAPGLEAALHKALSRARLVVLDLRDLAFIDSAGVHAIANCGVRARDVGRRLVILRGPANIERIFALAGISEQFEVGHTDSLSRVGRDAEARSGSGDPRPDRAQRVAAFVACNATSAL